jgi:formate dehydrogenase gamma subunit
MKKVYLHPLSIRIWHWLNAVVMILLMATGLQLRAPAIEVFGDYLTAVALHKWLGFTATALFLFWIACYVFGRRFLKHYLYTKKDLAATPSQVVYYLRGILRGKKNPFIPSEDSKFNPLQKLAYSFVMLICMPVIIITGILFSDILFFLEPIRFIGGLRVLDTVHVVVAYFFVLYLIVHVYMATLGAHWYSHISAMFTGWEKEHGNSQEREIDRGKQ